jgi:hypothetical protein
MLRKAFLIMIGVTASFALTALAGYVLYLMSEGRSEASLGVVARYIFNPLIAVLVGALIGALSKDRPGVVAALGLLPWVLTVRRFGLHAPVSVWLISVGLIVVYLLLGAGASMWVWRIRQGRVASLRDSRA